MRRALNKVNLGKDESGNSEDASLEASNMYVTSEREGCDGVSVCTPNFSCCVLIFPIRAPHLPSSCRDPHPTFWAQGTKLLPSPCFFFGALRASLPSSFCVIAEVFHLCSLSYYACSQFLLLSVYKQGVSSTVFASTGLCIIGSPFKILILSIHQHHSRPQTKRSRTLCILASPA